jgi:UDP-N-acetylglucosamine 2-epimerase
MISNRLRIEAAIQRAREHIRDQVRLAKSKRAKEHGYQQMKGGVGHQVLAQHAMNRELSDDGSGSADEAAFLELGIKNAQSEEEKQELIAQRKHFLASFSDRRDILDGQDITTETDELERQNQTSNYYEGLENSEDDDSVESLDL